MVRCMFQGKVYETCIGEEAGKLPLSVEEDSDGFGGGMEYMKECITNYPEMENVLEAESLHELRAAACATMIIEDHFDHLGQPRLKIVFVDIGDFLSDIPSEASKHIKTIIKFEKEREEREGRPRPRLIFIEQDRDYWPGSEKDPDVMARRAVKELRAYPVRPDVKEIIVPCLPEEEKRRLRPPHFADTTAEKAFHLETERLRFMRFYDPSMPGTKFVLDHLPAERDYVLNKYKEDPDLWKEWVRASQYDMTSSVNQSFEEMEARSKSSWSWT